MPWVAPGSAATAQTLQPRVGSIGRDPLWLEIERADMFRVEDGDRPTVEGRDPVHAEAFGRRDHEGIGEAWPVFGRGSQELRGPGEIRLDRRDEPDRAAPDGLDHGEGGRRPELALEKRIQVREGQRPKEQRLIGAVEPGHRGCVIEVGTVGRGQHDAGVQEDRHGRSA